jgi:hypothetical protein
VETVGRADLPTIAAATTSSTAASAIARSASPTAAAATDVALRASFIDGNRAAVQVCPVQRFDGGPSLVVVAHRHKGETARAARVTIGNHGHFFDLTKGRELGLQRFLSGRKGKVANVQLHRSNSKLQTLSANVLESYKATNRYREGKETSNKRLSIAISAKTV